MEDALSMSPQGTGPVHRRPQGCRDGSSGSSYICREAGGTVQLFVTPWTVACQAPLSKGFFRQEYWSGLPFPSPGDLPDPGIEPTSWIESGSSILQADALPSKPPGKPLWGHRVQESRSCCSSVFSLKIPLGASSSPSEGPSFAHQPPKGSREQP